MKTLLIGIVVGVVLCAGGGYAVYKLRQPKPGDPYEPTAQDVPIHEDYAASAEKVVRPDNYKAQLNKIDDDLRKQSRELH